MSTDAVTGEVEKLKIVNKETITGVGQEVIEEGETTLFGTHMKYYKTKDGNYYYTDKNGNLVHVNDEAISPSPSLK